jgi:hypothetical protein
MGSRLRKTDFLKFALPVAATALFVGQTGWADNMCTVTDSQGNSQQVPCAQATQALQGNLTTTIITGRNDGTATNINSTACKTSEKIDNGQYNCGNTQQAVTMWNQAGQLGQQLTNTASTAMGQMQQQNVMSSASTSGVISPQATMDAYAKTLEVGAAAQAANAAVTGTAAYMQYQLASKHTDNAAELSAAGKLKLKADGTTDTGTSTGTSEGEFGAVTSGLGAPTQHAANGSDTNFAANAIMGNGLDLNANAKALTAAKVSDPVSFNTAAAQITVGQDGRYSFNGQAVTAQNQAAATATLSTGCATTANAQNCADSVKSAVTRAVQANTRYSTVQKSYTSDANSASTEQASMASLAKQSAIKSGIQSAMGLLQAGMNMAAAKQEESLANNLTSTATPLTISSGTLSAGSTDTGTATGLSAGTNPDGTPLNAVLAGSGAVGSTGCGILGCASPASSNANQLAMAPTANPFSASGGGSGGGGGGSGGSVGDMTTSAANDPPAQDQPKAYDAKNGPAYVAGNPNLNGGGVAAEKGPDLSGLLAQFLPKKDDESKNGILDYGNRSPASAGDGSLLGPNENLFQRVSERMQADYRKGSVGVPGHKI